MEEKTKLKFSKPPSNFDGEVLQSISASHTDREHILEIKGAFHKMRHNSNPSIETPNQNNVPKLAALDTYSPTQQKNISSSPSKSKINMGFDVDESAQAKINLPPIYGAEERRSAAKINCKDIPRLKNQNSHRSCKTHYVKDAPNPRRVRATMEYKASMVDELSFVKGDIILMVGKLDGDWCMGERDGKQGLFPSSHVQKLDQNSSVQTLTDSNFIKLSNEC
mmetsp:Transcript_18190/g.23953  ORF Transcript_18190/g.23953 Transcript_18190/m.23953 type:complete len:222 (+) Transcript_18190:216-881(+)